jgi:hypothetical protein
MFTLMCGMNLLPREPRWLPTGCSCTAGTTGNSIGNSTGPMQAVEPFYRLRACAVERFRRTECTDTDTAALAEARNIHVGLLCCMQETFGPVALCWAR